MRKQSLHTAASWSTLLAAIGIAVYAYWPGLEGAAFGDDFWYWYQPGRPWTYYFLHPNPYLTFYRPFQWGLVGVATRLFGMSPEPIHLFTLAMHLAFAILLFVGVRREFGRLAALIAACFLLMSQAAASAVLGNDTASQVLSTLSGSIAVLSLWWSMQVKSPWSRWILVALSAIGFLIAIFAKETGVGFAALLILIAFVLDQGPVRGRAIRTGALALVLVFIMGFYLWQRNRIGLGYVPAQTQGRYQLHFGASVIVNTCGLLFAAITPISTVTTYVAMQRHQIVLVVLIVLATVALATVTVAGLARVSRNTVLLLVLLTGLATTPMIFIGSVSELYVYNILPFVAVLVGAGWAVVLRAGGWQRAALIASLAACAIGNVQATRSKAWAMRANGDRATHLISAILPLVRSLPPDTQVLLVNGRSIEAPYSVFRMNNADLLEASEPVIRQATGREDVSVVFWDRSSLPDPCQPKTLVLQVSDESFSSMPCLH